ncbi:MAG: hypothetical protein J6K98_00950 [Clostridia bacterium]|nr:hypothetical protein [Clostridia bacterium]
MYRRTRVLALSAALCLLLCVLSGCDTTPPEESEVSLPEISVEESTDIEEATLSVSYNADDTLSPFATVSRANLELASLLYEGLTRVDNTLTAQPALAASVERVEKTVTAVLRKDARFSDGSAVTASDVVRSFSLAKNSANYRVLLQNIRSASANKEGTAVTFVLESADIGYAACLSFPVIKASTATKEEGKAPVGSGLYRLADANTLTVNPYAGQTPQVQTVELISVSDSNALVHALENGTIGYLFTDLYGGTLPYTTAANTTVDIHYLIFLGINANRDALSDKQVRQALSLAVNRELLATEGCSGYARAATAPFHPLWAGLKEEGLTLFKTTADPNAAKQRLSAAGYATGLETDKKGGKALSLTLLVNADNPFRTTSAALLQIQCAAAGITLKVEEKPYDEYLKQIEKGSFDLYLGEVRLPADGSLRSFFKKGGGTSYGIKTAGTCATAYTSYLAGDVTLAQFLKTFGQELPFIPLNWQKGMAAFKRSYQNITPGVLDPYYGLGSWDIN